ncbi:MAG TPA: amino acid adenylation domain-containing protein [Pseudonocardiaceae bacterium]
MALVGRRSPLPDVQLVHGAFEAHAHRTPNAVALTSGADSLTYAELNARANRFAHHLGSLGVGPGSVVGVCLDRVAELMVSILGILKAGAAYLPLDPTYPRERLRLMLTQLDQVKFTIVADATAALIDQAPGETLLVDTLTDRLDPLPDTNPDVAMRNDDLCYVVFTSGSTGTPKATAVRHSGWYNLLEWLRLEYRLGAHSSGLSVSSFGFDISQRGLMAPLFVGATLHLLPSRVFDPRMAYRLLGRHGVRTLHCAPSTLYVLIDQERAQGADFMTRVDHVFIGGEPLNVARVQEWATKAGNTCNLLHQYGVAECTDVASSHELRDYSRYRSGPVPVGPPVYNTEIRILDDDLREVPDGEIGEICISGASVSAGYLNAAPDDTLRFTEIDIDGAPVPIYRTGDRGHLTPAGELVVAGRLDAQIKIRGMRIDLGDVEHAVRGLVSVRDVVVLALPDADGERSLVAFVVPAGNLFDQGTVRSELAAVLPRNMVPQEFVAVPAFPLNPNGKIDRRALSANFRGNRTTTVRK